MNNMKKSTKISLIVTIVSLLVAIFAVSYAFFLARITGNDDAKNVVIKTASMEIVYEDLSGEVSLPSATPGSEITKNFKITNVSGTQTEYSIYFSDVINQFERNYDLVYTLTCESTYGGSTESCDIDNGYGYIVSSNAIVPKVNATINPSSQKIKIRSTEVQNYSLTIKYLYSSENQDIDKNKTFSTKIKIDEATDATTTPDPSIPTTPVLLDTLLDATKYENASAFQGKELGAYAPFVFKENVSSNNFVLYGKTLDSMRFKVAIIDDINTDPVFTIKKIIKSGYAKDAPLTATTYTQQLTIPKETFTNPVLIESGEYAGKYQVNEWVDVDLSSLNLKLETNELLALFDNSDTLRVFYINSINSEDLTTASFYGIQNDVVHFFPNKYKLPVTFKTKMEIDESSNVTLVSAESLEDTSTYTYKAPNTSLFPFIYKNNGYVANKRLNTIKLHVAAVDSLTEDSTFTIAVYEKSILSGSAFQTPLREYQVTVPKETFAGSTLDTDTESRTYNKYVFNNWITVDIRDLNIVIHNNELLSLFKQSDTMIFNVVYNGPDTNDDKVFVSKQASSNIINVFSNTYKLPYTITGSNINYEV